MPIRRLLLDVDKAVADPDLIELAQAVERAPGVQAVNITVTDIDVETVGTDLTVEGEDIDVKAVMRSIENTGAVVHSIDEVVAGAYTLAHVVRSR
ncbi:DUF211 domain-containing protein [Streptomyces sp. NPDC047046]|uniref:DUF211 domain-containing protein n=1 Tax=Streptomyces sp. NPDC047046 TaxID=3155378 RepID=UPI0033C0B24C